MGGRGIAVTIVALAAVVLAIISTATTLYYVDRTINTNNAIPIKQSIKYSAWEICTESSLGTVAVNSTASNSADCTADFDCFSTEIRVVRAFSILTIAFAFIVLVIGIIDICEVLPRDPFGKSLLTVLCTFAFAVSVVCWAIELSLWSNDCAGTALQDIEGARFGPSAILMIVASGLLLISIFFALLISGTTYVEDDVAVESPTDGSPAYGSRTYNNNPATEDDATQNATQNAPYGYPKGYQNNVVVGEPIQEPAYIQQDDEGQYVQRHAPAG